MNCPIGQDHDRNEASSLAADMVRQARKKRVSARMIKLARLRTAISVTNRAIIRSQSLAEVYRAVCRACVEQTEAKLVWIGVADAAGGRLVPVEIAGAAESYLADENVALSPVDAEAKEPVAAAYREQRAAFCNDLQRDGAAGKSWRERASANGLHALIALPLLRGGMPYGMFAAYGPERNFFDADSAEMLLDMADNISFAIDQFDRAEERRLAEEKLRHSAAEREQQAERLENLSRRLVAVQENERRGLARELHDRANPNLAAIKLILSSVESALPDEAQERVKPLLLDVQGLVDDTAAGIREICADLRPTLLDYTGLVPTLESYAEMFTKRTGVPVRLHVPPAWARLPQDVECMLFRVAQEALTNCAKHACARSVDIELLQSERRQALVIRDDGFGFEPQRLGRSGSTPGLGLISMRERAEFAGARFYLSSHALKGTEVRVEIDEPAAPRRDAVRCTAADALQTLPETL